MFSAATVSALTTGVQLGSTLGGVASGILGAITARKQAAYAIRASKRQAEIQGQMLQQQALDNLTLADYTSARTLLEAQDAEIIGRVRANARRQKGQRELGALRFKQGGTGADINSPGLIMALADSAYQTEMAANAERFQGEYTATNLRDEATFERYRARIGMASARKGQQALIDAASVKAQGIQQQANTQLITSLTQGLLGPQTLTNVFGLLGNKPRAPAAPQDPLAVNFFAPIDTGNPLGLAQTSSYDYWG